MKDNGARQPDFTDPDEVYRNDPYGVIAWATEKVGEMSDEEAQALLRRAGTLGDDGSLTKYAGGDAELSREYVPLPGEEVTADSN